jgi:DNA-directed RNA polymerase subunit H (RpoH/RPB5)
MELKGMKLTGAAKMNQSREIVKSFETIYEMMADRRTVSEAGLLELAHFRDNSIAQLATNARPVSSCDFPECSLRVIYNMHPKFKVNDVKKMLDYDGVVLLVCRERPGTLALKGLEEAGSNIQVFGISELQFNVSKHSLVPKHEPVRDDAEIARIIKDCIIKSKFQLPLIHNTDPMARYLALKPGELVRILRLSPSAGEYVSYRCCIKAA